MYSIKTVLTSLLCLSLFACSSTEQVHHEQTSNNGYYQSEINKKFSHKFTPVNQTTIKKPLSSDHQLMMSLLNRPMTEDQAMMLAFAEQRQSYSPAYANFGVEIKGERKTSKQNQRSTHLYAHLIEQDINAVAITAPPQ